MTSPDTTDILADRPQPLPVIPRPRRDETLGSYVRRLALANHLRPSYLRLYLCAPPTYQGSIRAARLAVLTNRTVDALTRHFTTLQAEARPHRLHPEPDTPTPHEPEPDEPPRRRRSIASLAKKRGQKGARELLNAIRHEAKINPSLRSITRKFRVQADTVLLALTTDPNPTTPSRRRTPRRNRIFDPYAHIIDDLLAQNPTISRWEIWEHLVDEHGAELSYGSVRDYIIGKIRGQTVPRSRKTERTSPKRGRGADQPRKPDHPPSQSN